MHKKDFDPSWRLKIAGEGTEEGMLHLSNLCKKYHVEDHVDFLGFCSDMQRLYRESEIFCLSSRSEGLPMSLLEAMSQGCAPVATDFKGRVRDILAGEETGIVCNPQDVQSLAEGLWKMMNDDEYRKTAQQNALDRSHLYSLDYVMSLWEKMFHKMKGNSNAE